MGYRFINEQLPLIESVTLELPQQAKNNQYVKWSPETIGKEKMS